MAVWFRNLPFFNVLLLCAGGAMFLPAVMAAVQNDYATARDFLYSALVVLVGGILIGFANQIPRRTPSERSHLATVFLSYLWLPVILSLPMNEAVGNTRFINVYFDMVSALTTTGAEVFEPTVCHRPSICGAVWWGGLAGF